MFDYQSWYTYMKLFNKFLTIIESRFPGMDELFAGKHCSCRNIYRVSSLSLLFLRLSKNIKWKFYKLIIINALSYTLYFETFIYKYITNVIELWDEIMKIVTYSGRDVSVIIYKNPILKVFIQGFYVVFVLHLCFLHFLHFVCFLCFLIYMLSINKIHKVLHIGFLKKSLKYFSIHEEFLISIMWDHKKIDA